MRPYPFSASQQDEIASRYLAGSTIEELYAEFGSSTCTIWKILKNRNIPTRATGITRRTLVLTGERQSELRKRIGQGESQPKIAIALGVSTNTVHKWLKQLNLLPGIARGERHPAWNGGIKHVSGYRQVRMSKKDPLYSMAARNGQVLEHRLILARHLERPLLASETVHHINGNREDNRIENLQLRHQKHGNGVAMVCLCCGSRNIGYSDI